MEDGRVQRAESRGILQVASLLDALAQTKRINRQVTEHAEQISRLAETQSEQQESIARMTIVIGHLKQRLALLLSSNERVKRALGAMQFALCLVRAGKRKGPERRWPLLAVEVVAALAVGRAVQRATGSDLLVGTVVSGISAALGASAARARAAKNATVLAILLVAAYHVSPFTSSIIDLLVKGKQ